jgi:hypothetical protein
MNKKESWIFWLFLLVPEGIIVLSVTLLSLKTSFLNYFHIKGLAILFLYEITVFAFCIFVVLISRVFAGYRVFAVNKKLLYIRALASVLTFIYVVYSLGAAFAESNMLFIIELIILLFLTLNIWIVHLVRVIRELRGGFL